MPTRKNNPRLEGAGWFENKVSEAEFSGFKNEVMQFKAEMTEFKQEIFEKIRRHALMRMNDRDNITDLEKRVSNIEQQIEPPELTESPYSSEEEEEEIANEDDMEEEQGVDNANGSDNNSSSSTSDSGESESDDENAQDDYYRRRLYDEGDEI